ncbi:MAG: IPExxxVDY family protein [Bacteroidia bacterium]
MKKEVLHISYNLDFLVFGITTSLKPTRLAWNLNDTGLFDFFMADDLMMYNSLTNSEVELTKFEFIDEENHLNWILLCINDAKNVFIKTLKPFDYLLLVNGGTEFLNIVNMQNKIRNISGVYAINSIDNKKIKEQIGWIFETTKNIN